MVPLNVPGGPREVELAIGSDIARLLGVSRQRVNQLAGRPGFPRPIGYLGRSAVWRRRDIEAWAVRIRRPLADP